VAILTGSPSLTSLVQEYGDGCGRENQPANGSVTMKYQEAEKSENGKVSK
jgi:hypothetical protein